MSDMRPSNKTTGGIGGATSQIKNTKDAFKHFGITERQGVEYEILNSREQLKNCLSRLPEKLEDKKSKDFKFSLYFDPEVCFSVIEIEVGIVGIHEKRITTKEQIRSIKISSAHIDHQKSVGPILDHFKCKANMNDIISQTSTLVPERAIHVLEYLGVKTLLHKKEKSRYTFLYDPDIPFTLGIIENLTLI